MAKPQSTRLTIAGTPVDVTHETVELTELKLDPKNPRIRLQVILEGREKPHTPTQLIDLMKGQPGYSLLQSQIRRDGGIHDPLLVRHDGRIVEGNTRFTVLTVLSKTAGGAEKWGSKVPIMRLPPDVPEKVIQLQMAGYHVSGKNKWRAAAKADHVYRLVMEEKAGIDDVVTATGMTPKQIQQNIDAYEYLLREVLPAYKGSSAQAKREILESKFSHALVLMTTRALKGAREDKAERKKIANLIANTDIKGAQVRDLAPVLENPQAKAALEKTGYRAAKKVLHQVHPLAESKTLKAVEKLTVKLSELEATDITLFGTNAEAREALEALATAIDDVLNMGRKAKRRA